MGWSPKRNAVTRDRYRPHPQGVRGVCLYCGAAAERLRHGTSSRMTNWHSCETARRTACRSSF